MRLLEGSFTLYTSLSVRVSKIRAKLVCFSITSKQAKIVPECCYAVQRWKWRCPLTEIDQRGSQLFTIKVKSMTVRTDNSQHAQVEIVNIVL